MIDENGFFSKKQLIFSSYSTFNL